MIRSYIVFCVLVSALVAYANLNGWRMLDIFTTGKWGPRGASHYHK